MSTPPLAEPTLFYDPPYERPLEDEFAWHLVKYLSPATALRYQEAVQTQGGKFWIDFLVEHGSRRIGFELGDLEGAEDPAAFAMRDALVVGSGDVHVLYRFRGGDVLHRLHDCLRIVAHFDPELFSTRGHVNLNTLASPEAMTASPKHASPEVRIDYPPDPDPLTDTAEEYVLRLQGDVPEAIILRRLSRDLPANWIKDYDRALAHYGLSAEVSHA